MEEDMMMDTMTIQRQFLAAMRQGGFEPDCTIVANGKIHRFRDWLDKPGTRDGWYVCFADFPPAGVFGCWRRGIRQTWTGLASEDSPLLAKRMSAIRQLVVDEHEKGRRFSQETLDRSVLANGKHKYLVDKKVKAYGIYYFRGALMVPVMDAAGKLHGLQRIYHDGSKRFSYGTNKIGHYFMIGMPHKGILLITEGYATAATIHEITAHAVVIAFDAGNLLPVGQSLRSAYPECRLVFCADNDRFQEKNSGLSKARLAAEHSGGEVAWPEFANSFSRGTDFNDLYREEGAEAVKCRLARFGE
jgi:putative DNA primase/helicase